jgi:ankyrin repeat protein
MLLKAGIDSKAKDNNGRTALQDAAKKGHEIIVHVLVQIGVSLIEGDKDDSSSTTFTQLYARRNTTGDFTLGKIHKKSPSRAS